MLSRDDRSNRSVSPKPISPLWLLLPLAIAIAVELFLLPPATGQTKFLTLVDHLMIALMVASILGLTYEYFLNKRRLDELFERMESEIQRVLETYAFASPDKVLELLSDVADQSKLTPTLFRVAREGNESTFVTNLQYFDALIAVRRKEVCELLREWIRPQSSSNVKFLASDFIGHYGFTELNADLSREIDVQTEKWEQLDDEEKRWTLNYIWALSRMEIPRYKRLADFLCDKADEKAESWILFVPIQMPEKEFVDVILRYLGRAQKISEANLKAVLKALAKLQDEGRCNAKDIIGQHHRLFQAPALQSEIQRLFSKGMARPPVGVKTKNKKAQGDWPRFWQD